MIILGIETSCDETSVAVIEARDGKIKVLSNVVSSQTKIHSKFGGVVPQLAAREHAKNLKPVFELALKEAQKRKRGLKVDNIDLIAVTRGPGLIMALVVGTTFARSLAWALDKPIIGVNHMEGHIYSNWLQSVGQTSTFNFKPSEKFPILNLIVSGGHTMLVLMKGHGKYKLLGETLDDAAGEAFDKVARMLELGYPGGPLISKAAEKGDDKAFNLPRPMINKHNYNFSFSGLKTAVLYLLRNLGKKGKSRRKDIAASFQKAVVDVLVVKAVKAAKEYKVKAVLLSGGVSANKLLRKELIEKCKRAGVACFVPHLSYTGDNAAMIAAAGYFRYTRNKKTDSFDWKSVEADANLRI